MDCVEVVEHLAKHGLNEGQQIKADKDPSYGEGLVDAFNCLQPDIDHKNLELGVHLELIGALKSELELYTKFYNMLSKLIKKHDALGEGVSEEMRKVDQLLVEAHDTTNRTEEFMSSNFY